MAKFCSECGTQIRDGAKFCPTCGKAVENTVLQQPKCAYCGAELKETSKFCPKCGRSVSSPMIQQTPPASQPVRQEDRPSVTQVAPLVQIAAQPVRQAVQNTVGQVTQPFQQAIGGIGGIGNTFNALQNPGEAAMNLPEMNLTGMSSAASQFSSAASTVAGAAKGGMPGVVKLLISLASGGASFLLLNQLSAPWSFLVGLGISIVTGIVASVIKKKGGGDK
jgi:RNA polymerase subunit RPABC4/transcription elongation factor Spt4